MCPCYFIVPFLLSHCFSRGQLYVDLWGLWLCMTGQEFRSSATFMLPRFSPSDFILVKSFKSFHWRFIYLFYVYGLCLCACVCVCVPCVCSVLGGGPKAVVTVAGVRNLKAKSPGIIRTCSWYQLPLGPSSTLPDSYVWLSFLTASFLPS